MGASGHYCEISREIYLNDLVVPSVGEVEISCGIKYHFPMGIFTAAYI